MQLYLKQVPFIKYNNSDENNTKININRSLRNKLKLNKKTDSEFNRIINELIPLYIPMSYVEKFCDIEKWGLKNLPRNCNKIVSAGSDQCDDNFKIWLAGKVNSGKKFYAVQHGGGYGVLKWNSCESLIYSYSDKFITWGWGNNNNNKEINLPASKLIGLTEKKK